MAIATIDSTETSMISMILVRRSFAVDGLVVAHPVPGTTSTVGHEVRQDVDRAGDHHDRGESDSTDSAIIAIFAHAWTGNVSVGLNAVAFVNDR